MDRAPQGTYHLTCCTFFIIISIIIFCIYSFIIYHVCRQPGGELRVLRPIILGLIFYVHVPPLKRTWSVIVSAAEDYRQAQDWYNFCSPFFLMFVALNNANVASLLLPETERERERERFKGTKDYLFVLMQHRNIITLDKLLFSWWYAATHKAFSFVLAVMEKMVDKHSEINLVIMICKVSYVRLGCVLKLSTEASTFFFLRKFFI